LFSFFNAKKRPELISSLKNYQSLTFESDSSLTSLNYRFATIRVPRRRRSKERKRRGRITLDANTTASPTKIASVRSSHEVVIAAAIAQNACNRCEKGKSSRFTEATFFVGPGYLPAVSDSQNGPFQQLGLTISALLVLEFDDSSRLRWEHVFDFRRQNV
jgi:hypothetical protein